MTFEETLREIDRRHPTWGTFDLLNGKFPGNPGVSENNQESRGMADLPTVVTKRAPDPVSVRLDAAPDRMSLSAGDDWAEVWDDTTGEAEAIE